MKNIIIGNTKLNIKDYYCDNGEGIISRNDEKLMLYVNITSHCNARCHFCINPSNIQGENLIDLNLFENTLRKIKSHIYAIAITGGEPMLYPELIDNLLDCIYKVFEDYIPIELVTNGSNIHRIIELKNYDSLDSIHISRHRVDDLENNMLFGVEVAKGFEIKNLVKSLSNSEKIVFNCILMTGGVDCIPKISDFLEFAADVNICNTCFIGMSKCNSFCVENYIDPKMIFSKLDSRFSIWNSFNDYTYCSCSSGSYKAKTRDVRFYFRSIGESCVPYVRQLVYTADNRLLAGFGGKEIKL